MYIYPLYVRSKIYPDRPDRLDVTAITVPAVGCMRGTAVANTWIAKFPEQNDLYISFGTARPGAEGVVCDNTLQCLSTFAAYATLA